MLAIFKREFKSYFHSFIGCLFISAIICITGIYVTVYNLLSGLPNISYALSAIIFIFIISIPILTMRVLAEERKQKSDQLILTAPISVGKIVIGKFLALALVFTISVAVISIYPLLLAAFGTVPLLESYVAILAFYLYGLTCISIGVFISSLTESQVIAAVVTFIILFLGYVMSGISNMISTTGNYLTKILSTFDLVSRFENLIIGTLDIKSIVYYITVIILMLFFTTQSIQKRRYSVSVKNIRIGAYSLAMVVISIIICVMINLSLGKIPSNYITFDLTSNKLYSLTKETENLLDSLQTDVTIYVLANENTQDATLKKTLEQYNSLSEHIEVSYEDPAVNPKFYSKYSETEVNQNSIIVVNDKRSKVIDYSSIYETSIDYSTYSSIITGYDGEGQISSAISYVTSENMPKIYMIEGHGELSFETGFSNTISKSNIEYEVMNLLKYDNIPADAKCIIINAPTSDFSEDDTNKVLHYLENGGNAFIVSTWTDKPMTNFLEILDYYNISVVEGLVLEGDSNAYYQSPFYLLPIINSDVITSSSGDSFIFVPYAQGMVLPAETGDDQSLTPLLTTSDEAYSRSEVNEAMEYARQEDDISGPFVLGVKAIKSNADTESTAVIYSSESIFTDAADTMVSGSNMKLFTGTLGALVKETESIAIPAKSYDMNYLTIPQSYIVLMGLMITIIIPLIIIISGFIIWFRRRRL